MIVSSTTVEATDAPIIDPPSLRRDLALPDSTDVGANSVLSLLATRATQAIETILGYSLHRRRYTEFVNNQRGNRVLTVSRRPVRTIHSVKYMQGFLTGDYGPEIPADQYSISNALTGKLLNLRGWDYTPSLWSTFPTRVAYQEPTHVVDYEAGYEVGAGNPDHPLPGDIVEATFILARYWYHSQGQDFSLEEKRIGDLQLVTGRRSGPLKVVHQMLSPHMHLTSQE